MKRTKSWSAQVGWRALILLTGALLGGWSASPAAAGGAKSPRSRSREPSGTGPARLAGPTRTDRADLDLVPPNALGFIHLRAADFWRSDWARDIRYFVDKAGPDAWKAFEKKCPIDPATLDRVTVILLTPQTLANPFPNVDPEAMSALVVVTTNKPFDRLTLIQALGSKEKVYRHHVYYFNEELWSGLAVVDERTFLIGSEEALVRFFEMSRRPDPTGPLQPALTEAHAKHQMVIGLNPGLLSTSEGAKFMPPSMQQLLGAHGGILTLDLDDGIQLKTRLDYLNEDKAGAGEKALRDTIQLARQGLSQPIGELEKMLRAPERASPADLPQGFGMLVAVGFLRELDTLLKEAPVNRQGLSVQFALTYKKQASAPLLLASVGSVTFLGQNVNTTFTSVGPRIGNEKGDPIEKHLRTLAQALDKYRDEHGAYPPPAIYDREGRPVLSWRVALLPYLGEEALHKSFKLDEPWDSLHNKRLLKRFPNALRSDNDYRFGAGRWKTATQVFAGENTVFEGTKGARKTDVAREAILLARVSTDAEVYWTKPADLAYAADKPLPNLYGKYGNRFQVLLTDGTYRTIDKSMDERAIRALIERSDKKPAKSQAPSESGDLETVWNELMQNDDAGTKKAWQSIIAMSKDAKRVVPFVQARVKPAPGPDPERIAQCLADLDSNIFQKRAKASAELEGFGSLATAAIDKRLADKSLSLEARRYLEAIAQKAKTVLSGAELRGIRAVEVLEQIATTEARAVLDDLSRGAAGAVLTEQARKALARLMQRSQGR
jgi:hypothetical protein